jgi:hypothetical protein
MIIPMENNIKEELKDLYPNYEPFRKKIKSKHYKLTMKEKTLIEYKTSVFAHYVDLNQVIKREKNNIDIENLQELELLSDFLMLLFNELNK